MKNASTILKTIMAKLGMEVKLEQMKLSDGVTVIEADSFEPEMEVFIIAEDEQKIPLPIGEYELEDGRMLVVEMEGVIASVNEAPMEEEVAPEEEVAVEVPVEAEAEPKATQPKSIIESTSKEYKFSDEEKDAKILELEAKILELTKVEEEVELSAEIKPISFNPENVNKIDIVELSANAPKKTRDSILESIYNSK